MAKQENDAKDVVVRVDAVDVSQDLSDPPVQSPSNPLPPVVNPPGHLPEASLTVEGRKLVRKVRTNGHGHYPDKRFRIAVEDEE